MPILYGHKYLGPGNKLDVGAPVDTDDVIAKKHDYLYAYAKTNEEIRHADLQAIKEFGNEYLQHGNVHAAIGAVGLGAKYIGEGILGVQYPAMFRSPPKNKNWAAIRDINRYRLRSQSLPDQLEQPPPFEEGYTDQLVELDDPNTRRTGGTGVKRGHRGDPEPQPGPSGIKRSREDDNMQHDDNAMDVADADRPDAGGVRGGFSGGGVPNLAGHQQSGGFQVFKAKRSGTTYMNFEQTYRVSTWGHPYTEKNVIVDNITVGSQIITPLAYLSLDVLMYYMTPAEFEMIKGFPWAKVNKVHVSVQPVGVSASFEANSTLSGTASVAHYVEGLWSEELNEGFLIKPQKVTYVSGSTLDISTTTPGTLDDIQNTFIYGTTAGLVVGHKSFPHYTSVISSMANTKYGEKSGIYDLQYDMGKPIISKYVDRFAIHDAITNKIVFAKSHKFSEGYVWTDGRDVGISLKDYGIEMNSFGSIPKSMTATAVTKDNTRKETGRIRHKIELNDVDYDDGKLGDDGVCIGFNAYNQLIEKQQIVYRPTHPPKGFNPTPIIHFGSSPVNASNPVSDNTYVMSHVEWMITFHMVLEVGYGSPFIKKLIVPQPYTWLVDCPFQEGSSWTYLYQNWKPWKMNMDAIGAPFDKTKNVTKKSKQIPQISSMLSPPKSGSSDQDEEEYDIL